MSVFFEKSYLVDTREIDPFGHCRASALLGILQESGTDAAVQLHVSRSEIITHYNAFWMLARIWYRLDRPLRWNEQLDVKTWHRGGKGASMYRDFDLSVGGKPVGEAVSTWVMADVDTHKLLRLTNVREFTYTTGGALCKDKLLSKLHLPEGLELAQHRTLHYSDADINGHVNNSKYADFACDALHMERLDSNQFLSSLQVGYLAECLPGEALDLLTVEHEGTHYVRGADEQGRARFEAALTMGKLDSP